jgi:ligand-binding sensor domain-containing protein
MDFTSDIINSSQYAAKRGSMLWRIIHHLRFALILLTFFLIAQSSWLLHAEPFMVRKYLNRTDGLPSNTVRHILYDKQGLLWIITEKGICLYDGQRVYPLPLPTSTKPEQNIAALEQSIFTGVEDSNRTMWFATISGLIRYTPRTGNWKWYRFKQSESSLFNQTSALLCDRTGTLWVGTQGGLLRYDKAKDSFLLAFPKLPQDRITGLDEGTDGRIWFALSPSLLATYQPRTGNLSTGVPKGCGNGFFMHRISGTGITWISPLSGANQVMGTPRPVRLDTVKNEFTVSPSPLALSSESLYGIDFYPLSVDESGGWYVRVQDYAATRCESGLYRIVPDSNKAKMSLDAFIASLFNEQIFRGTISAFCRNPRTGVTCVGISGQGLTVLIPTGMQRIGDRRTIGDVISVHSDRRGRLWYGTYKGLFLRTNKGPVTIPFAGVPTTSKNTIPTIPSRTAPEQANIPVYDIQETSTGTILVGSIEGVFRYDEANKILRPFQTLTAFIGKTTVRNVQPDPMSREFWVYVPSLGVVRCREDGSPLGYFPFGQPTNTGDDQETLGTSNIIAMRFDSTGSLWLGGTGALLRWQRQTRKLERVTTLPNKELTLQPMRFIQPSKNSLLTAFFGIGIGYINSLPLTLNESTIKNWLNLAPINNQLRDVQINGIAADGGTLWWTTRTNGVYRAKFTNPAIDGGEFAVKGLQLLLPSDNNSVLKNTNDNQNNLTERGANLGAITSDRSGGVIFDYYGDVLHADHRAREFTDTARVVPIGYFRNDSLMAGLPQHLDTAKCSYNGSFAFSLAVVSLARPERHRLEYRLEGVDAVWNTMPDASLRTVRYSSLQPGEYMLEIRTSAQEPTDDAPTYSANTFLVTISVPYPWWMHPVTRTVGFLAMAAGFVWVGYRVQHQRTEKRLKELQRDKDMEELRRMASEAQMQTLRLQMKPHFLYNVLAEIQHLVETQNPMASHYVAIFSRLLSRILYQAGKDFIAVSDEIDILQKYMELEELRNAGRLQCYVLVSSEIAVTEDGSYDHDSEDSQSAYWQARSVPTFILQPFVENAIRHGIRGLADADWATREKGIITVDIVEETSERLRCVITDNGIGRNEAERRKALRPHQENLSIATSVTQGRLALLSKLLDVTFDIEYNDLLDENGTAAGTQVTVRMPCQMTTK